MRSKSLFLKVLAIVAVVALLGVACKKNNPTPGGSTAATSGASGSTSTSGASGGQTTAAQKVDVTVYAQGAWTGPYNYLVLPSIQGMQLHFKELNDDPSFPATIKLAEADTQGSGDNAPPVAATVVQDPNTVAVAGPAFSGETRAVGDTYNQAGIPFVTQSATAVDLGANGWDYWYRTVGNDDLQGGNDGHFLAKVVKSKNLYVADDTSDYGKPLADTVDQTATSDGVKIAGRQSVAPTDDYSSLISDIKSSGADTVFYGGYDADFAKIVKQGVAAGLKVNWMSGDGSVSSTFLSSAGDAAEGTYLSIPSNLGGDFVQKYNDAYGSKASTVPVYAAEGYDVAGLIGEGIKQAIAGGATSPTDIRTGIKTYLDSLTVDSPYAGVAKAIAFTDNHELDAKDPASLLYFYQVKDGKMNPLGNAADLNLG
ncbi:MAG TPA: branched-chain amino acid ABC transporter substrate-binding protein [Actinomycetota bacterium]|nr:branched-chain amino acid ABC transporter substrate-binding protein [Actinomycetota bacterium]